MALTQRNQQKLKEMAYTALDAVVDDLDERKQIKTLDEALARNDFLVDTLRELHRDLMEMVN